tara:strand:- start:6740 stop:7291 length:552 start_codon:yes stop_codon:yes gene_type:complete
MIDGGGANAVGNEFEGGGLLSMIANAIATPYGSSDRMPDDMQAQRPVMRPADAFAPNATSIRPQAQSPLEMFGGQQPAPYSLQAQSPLEMFGGQQPAPYSLQAQSPLEMFGGQQPAAYSPQAQSLDSDPSINPANAYGDPRERFAQQLVEMIGPDAAQNFMSSGMGEQAYQSFVANDYNMPNY